MKKLTEEEVSAIIAKKHLKWEVKNNALHRLFTFNDFKETFGFMCQVAILAEKHKHHPDWSNVYNKLEINLSTHDADGITEKDIKLAEEISKI